MTLFKVVIPARYASARLPGKPLRVIAGRPMLHWVCERACASGAEEIVVATDDERVAECARAFGRDPAFGQDSAVGANLSVMMTSMDHVCGTDRVAEVAHRQGWDDKHIVVNAQGDEPLLPPQLIQQAARLLVLHPNADIATLATPIDLLVDFLNPHVVKVVADDVGRALYFSRAPIPWSRESTQAVSSAAPAPTQWRGSRRHVGIYAYRVGALRRLAALPPAPLELMEGLEQLRALAAGFDLRVADGVVPPGPDVNTSADLERVSALLVASSVAMPGTLRGR